MTGKRHFLRRMAAAMVPVISVSALCGQVGITGSQLEYSQTFDSLPVPAVNGEVLEWVNGVTLPGWYRDLVTSSGTIDNSRNWSGDGSAAASSVPGLFNWGVEGTHSISDRALGMRMTTGQQGAIGVVFRNDGPRELVSLFIRFRGEQWRRSGQLVPTQLSFAYKVASAFNPAGYSIFQDPGFTVVPELDFVSPVFTAGGTGTDGNSSTYARVLSGRITFATPVQPGEHVILRWSYDPPSVSGHGLAIDDLAVAFKPTSAAGAPAMELVVGEAGPQVHLRWPALPGTLYTVEKSATLQAGEWTVGAEVDAWADEAEWLDPEPLAERAFYRLVWTEHTGGGAVHVADFGALPDDGLCDTEAINNAIQTALLYGHEQVLFDAGTYNLINTSTVPGQSQANYIGIFNAENLALVGTTGPDGRPATRLERNLQLDNDTDPLLQIQIRDSAGITVKNFILTNDPPLGSTGRVISVNSASDEVVIEVLDGLPAYDGMRCASAHAWNLDTVRLLRFGTTQTQAWLTGGLNITEFWQAVPGTGARQLKMTGAGFAAKVKVGDGISWHHRAVARNQTEVMHSRDITFENIITPNVSNMGMLAGYNHNITIRGWRFEPENGNLAVGGRDGFHFSNTSGHLLVEDSYFKSLRMDPLVIRRTYGIVDEVLPDGRIQVSPAFNVPVGDSLRFWVGDDPQDRVIASVERVNSSTYIYGLADPAPAGTAPGTALNYLTYSLASGLIRNCVFEDNFGSAIVNFEENVIVEHCVFDNNSYQIKYGPNQVSGGFVRNNVFRNNICENTSWVDIAGRGQPSILLIHSISNFFANPRYNKDILITGNVFRNPHGDLTHAAIEVRNATDVDILGNVFEGFTKKVVIHPQTTDRINFQE